MTQISWLTSKNIPSVATVTAIFPTQIAHHHMVAISISFLSFVRHGFAWATMVRRNEARRKRLQVNKKSS
jgi:hypothetical protein